MDNHKLFDEFSPVSTEQWKEKIIKDLKGADYRKKLVWQTGEGLTVEPFYRREDLATIRHKQVLPGQFPFVRGNRVNHNDWLVNQEIAVTSLESANAKALEIGLKGVDSLTFVFPEGSRIDEADTDTLLMNIRADIMELNFRNTDPVQMLGNIDRLAKKYNRDLEKVRGSVDCDPLAHFSLTGEFVRSREEDFDQLKQSLEAASHLPHFHAVTVDGSLFQNSGAGIVSEMAFTLAMATEYLNFLTDDFEIDEIAPHIRFRMAVGEQYFMQIAKFRAMRYLWSRIVNAYGLSHAENARMFIHAVSSQWNKTLFDPYVNMLRTTTESMSAGIGGVDALTVLPFDAVFEQPTEFSERIARNQQLILKGESYFNKVADPAAGSYYVENLTQMLIDEAWKLFLEVDEKGGYLAAFRSGFIPGKVNEEARQKDLAIATRKKNLLGTNQYPNPNEKPQKTELPAVDTQGADTVLRPYRGAQAFEQLRLKTERYAVKNKRPVVWLLPYGNLAMAKARAQFAGNFFGCAGFTIVDNHRFPSPEEGIRAARQAKPDLVVVCSSDDEYAQTALSVFRELKDQSLVVLAGYPKDLVDGFREEGFEHFIHVKSNVLEELKKYQQLLGVV